MFSFPVLYLSFPKLQYRKDGAGEKECKEGTQLGILLKDLVNVVHCTTAIALAIGRL